MRNYFVFVSYYLSNNSSPIECGSILLTDYRDCVDAWETATFCFGRHKEKCGYASFVITEFKEIK